MKANFPMENLLKKMIIILLIEYYFFINNDNNPCKISEIFDIKLYIKKYFNITFLLSF